MKSGSFRLCCFLSPTFWFREAPPSRSEGPTVRLGRAGGRGCQLLGLRDRTAALVSPQGDFAAHQTARSSAGDLGAGVSPSLLCGLFVCMSLSKRRCRPRATALFSGVTPGAGFHLQGCRVSVPGVGGQHRLGWGPLVGSAWQLKALPWEVSRVGTRETRGSQERPPGSQGWEGRGPALSVGTRQREIPKAQRAKVCPSAKESCT